MSDLEKQQILVLFQKQLKPLMLSMEQQQQRLLAVMLYLTHQNQTQFMVCHIRFSL